MGRIIFVTGTDTGVGKTIFAAALLSHLRTQGRPALAMKPFCSGSRDDVKLLQALQSGELTDEEVNPFYFPEAVAPLVSARRHRRKITLRDALRQIRNVQRKCDFLIIEGSGGLMVPLGDGYCVANVIGALRCEVVVVARNRLGTINHALLTTTAVKKLRPAKTTLVLMNCGTRDGSTNTNSGVLRELLAPIPLVDFPFLGRKMAVFRAIHSQQRILKKVLAQVLR